MSKISKSRLLATSAIASLSVLSFAVPAQAQDRFGIHNDQPETLEITVAEDDEDIVGSDIGVYADNGAVTLNNDGEIRGNGTNVGSPESRPSGGVVIAQPNSTIVNSGEISGAANGVVTSYFFSEDENDDELPPEARAANTSVTNTGSIQAESGTGVGLSGGGSVVNSGFIQGLTGSNGAQGVGVALSEFPDAIAPDATGIGSITNTATGVIEGQAFGAVLAGGGTIDNQGAIRSTGSPAPGASSIGVILSATEDQTGRVATLGNGGSISGAIGVIAVGSLESATIDNSGVINGFGIGILGQSAGDLIVHNAAEATISAGGNAIAANFGTLTVDNAGTIRGNTQNGIALSVPGASVTNSGTIEGAQSGIHTSAGADGTRPTDTTIENSGAIRGANGNGVGLVDGGSLVNSGTIQGFGAQGIGAFIGELAGGAASGATGVGSIDNAEGGVIEGQLYGAVLSGGGTVENDGIIRSTGIYNPANPNFTPIGLILTAVEGQEGRSATLDNEGVVSGLIGVLVGGTLDAATIDNSGMIQGQAVAIFSQFDVDLAIHNEGQIVSFGANAIISGPGPLTVDNSGTIRSNALTAISVTAAEADITNSGEISGANGDGIYLNLGAGGTATIVNAEDGVIGGGESGVHADHGALDLTNAGTIRGDGGNLGFDAPPDAGVTISGGVSSVTNSGTISGSGFGITTANHFNAATGQLEGLATGTTVVNSGTIIGDSDDGVRLIGGGSVTNSGTIYGQIGAGADGISMFAYTDQANADYSALVTNEESGEIAAQRFGVILSGGGDVANAGSILGGSGGVYVQGTALNSDPNEDRSGLTASVVNSGTIRGLGDFGGSNGDGYGVGFGSDMSTATLDNSGSISSDFGVGVLHGSRADVTLTNAAGGTITGATSGIYSNATGTLDVINAGTIRGEGTYDGFDAPPDAGITIGTASSSVTNSGTISGAGAGITTTYLYDEEIDALVGLAVGTEVSNSGTISGEFNDGVRLIGGGSVANSGTISGTGRADADGVSMYAYEGQASENYGALVTNDADGEISGDRFGIILSGGGAVENAGSIAGGDGGLFIQGTAIDSGDRSGLTASVVNSGTIAGSRADGLNGYGLAFGSDLATATLDNSGTISSDAGAGVYHGTLGEVSVGNSAAGVIDGAAYGIYADGEGSLAITNAGTIRSAGTGIESLTRTSLDNAGTIVGEGGVAVQLGAFDDAVTLRTGSAITGAVDAGAGIDRLTLDGDVLELTDAQQLGTSTGFETLEVAAGYWTTSGVVGEFDNVTIAEGGALQVNEADLSDGEGLSSPILTPAVTTNGRLVLNFSENDVVSQLDELSITGTGTIELIGEAVFTVDTATVAHTGGTLISNGGLVLTGTLLGDVTTAGDGSFQLGAGGTEGSFSGDIVNDGRFIFNRSDDYDFLGAFSGSGILDKLGGGILTFMGDYSFEGITNIMGGAVRIGGLIDPETGFNLGEGGTLDISGMDQTIASLAGEEGASVQIGANTLTVDQDDNSEFAGTISGTGGFTKDGDGKLNLTGTSDYTGPTNVNGGTLAVNGSIASSPVTVSDGGTLGGNGTVGSTTVASGGTIAPGNSIGRLTVAGDLDFAAGSTYVVEVNAAGEGDRLDATGAVTIASTASVSVLAEDGDYNPRTDYLILTGAGGVTGTFGSVTSDLAFLDPLLRYGPNAVTLSLYRNDIDFADVAVGANQAGVAAAIQSRGIDDPLFEALLVQNAAGAQAAYGDLSGEILADTLSGLTDDSRHLRNALLGLEAPQESGAFVWGSAFGGWGDFDAQSGGLGMDTDHKGLVAGFGYGGNGFAAALSAGIGNSDFRLDGRNDRAKADSKYLAAHLTYGTGEGFRGGFGLAFAWHDVDTTRSVAFAPLAQTLTSNRDADTLQLFGEVGYDLAMGKAAVTPFARLAHVRTKSDAFTETGGNAALALAGAKQETTFLSLGARARFNAGEPGFQPYLSAAWNRAFGDRAAVGRSAFASGGGTPFAITGLLIPRNSAEVEAGFDYSTGAFSLGAAYSGTLASDRSTHGVRVTARISF